MSGTLPGAASIFQLSPGRRSRLQQSTLRPMVILDNLILAEFIPAPPTTLLSSSETLTGRHRRTHLPIAALAGHIRHRADHRKILPGKLV
jgi:hypothetical protein